LLDGLNDIGPAAPAAAFAHGVAMVTRSDELEISKLLSAKQIEETRARQHRSHGARPTRILVGGRAAPR